MSGQDKAPLQPVEKALRAGVLNTLNLLELVSNSLTVTPRAAAAAGASLQDWVVYRMPDEVRFRRMIEEGLFLKKLQHLGRRQDPLQHWQQKKKSLSEVSWDGKSSGDSKRIQNG